MVKIGIEEAMQMFGGEEVEDRWEAGKKALQEARKALEPIAGKLEFEKALKELEEENMQTERELFKPMTNIPTNIKFIKYGVGKAYPSTKYFKADGSPTMQYMYTVLHDGHEKVWYASELAHHLIIENIGLDVLDKKATVLVEEEGKKKHWTITGDNLAPQEVLDMGVPGQDTLEVNLRSGDISVKTNAQTLYQAIKDAQWACETAGVEFAREYAITIYIQAVKR